MTKIESNKLTIDAYDKEASAYITQTPRTYQSYHEPMLRWIDTALKDLPNRNVLEIGSATSRDANYIRSHGFRVQTSDASKEFVRNLQSEGEDTILLDALQDPIPKRFGLIFANAVAPHFTRDDMKKFLNKTIGALETGGRLAFNVKIGDGESWINEKFTTKRFINFWQPEDMKHLLSEYGLEVIFFDTDVSGDLPSHHWINIVVEKI